MKPIRKIEKETMYCIVLGIVAAFILWITLISREQSETYRVLIPFWSYKAIFNGDMVALKENGGNMLMFFPLGILFPIVLKTDNKKTVISGLIISFLIESIQFITKLGCFEIDDIINNTFGMTIGNWLYSNVLDVQNVKISRKRLIRIVVISGLWTLLVLDTGLMVYKTIRYHNMVNYAALNDRASDGAKNLLILNGESGFVNGTMVYVDYTKDGSLTIIGKSDKRSWKRIAEIELNQGTYIFSGLSGVDKDTVAIELEYYDQGQENYVRLTPDVGSIDEASFVLEETTKIRAYVGVYENAECNVMARPVIYRED